MLTQVDSSVQAIYHSFHAAPSGATNDFGNYHSPRPVNRLLCIKSVEGPLNINTLTKMSWNHTFQCWRGLCRWWVVNCKQQVQQEHLGSVWVLRRMNGWEKEPKLMRNITGIKHGTSVPAWTTTLLVCQLNKDNTRHAVSAQNMEVTVSFLWYMCLESSFCWNGGVAMFRYSALCTVSISRMTLFVCVFWYCNKSLLEK